MLQTEIRPPLSTTSLFPDSIHKNATFSNITVKNESYYMLIK